MFKLAESLGANRGVYCGREGLYLGPITLIARSDSTYRLRPEEEIAAIFLAAYNTCLALADRISGLRRIAAALQRGELAQAMIEVLLLRLDEVSDDGLVRIEILAKANFNPDQPRDPHGRWTAEGAGSATGERREINHPALLQHDWLAEPHTRLGSKRGQSPAVDPSARDFAFWSAAALIFPGAAKDNSAFERADPEAWRKGRF